MKRAFHTTQKLLKKHVQQLYLKTLTGGTSCDCISSGVEMWSLPGSSEMVVELFCIKQTWKGLKRRFNCNLGGGRNI